MASLYEINKDILSCIDAETGEVIDFEMLEALQLERDTKIENIVCWIKNLLSDADAICAEKKSLEDREARCRKKANQLMKYLDTILDGQKFSTAKCVVSFRMSERVEVDESAVPQKYMLRKVTLMPDKATIKQLLKQGARIKGCSISRNRNIQIK